MNQPPVRLLGKLAVSTDLGAFLGDTRIRLLEAIGQHGSISQAAKHVPLSYKAAWDAVDAMNNLSDKPLVERSTGGRQGGGTRLTDHGRKLVALYRAIELESQAALDRLVARMDDGGDAATVRGFQQLLRRLSLRTSARNQLACTVSGMRAGEIDYEVFLRLDERTELKAVITRESALALEIGIGLQVLALIKAPSVLLMTETAHRISADNQLWGVVSHLHDGPVNSEVTVDLEGGRTMVSVVTRESVAVLGLAAGSRVAAVFQASSVILSVLG